MNLLLIFNLLLVPVVLSQTKFSTTERCGSANSGLMCDPKRTYGSCCSELGYCGSTPTHCSKANKCQSGCTESTIKATPRATNSNSNSTSKCGDKFCDARSETCASCPQDCGNCKPYYIDRCKKPGHISLTFNGGPSENTPNLLKFAKEKNVTITMFVVGNKLSNVTYQKYLNQTYQQGHTIASYTFTQPFITKLTDDELRQEMIKTDDAIYKIIKQRPIFMRNPYSDTDERKLSLLQSMNYKSIFPTLDSKDTTLHTTNPKKILQLIKQGLHDFDPKQTGLILSQNETIPISINYLPTIIQEINNRGYKIVPLHTCIDIPNPYRKDKCGDRVCSGYVENCSTCPQDCGVCPR